ncbi:Brf1-like TBP-binding domain-domain-containing protein [Yarrowia lipolytica]|jgi:transcription factor IIIB subunit 2|uniref:B-related factor 1 n=3 Tax=Yarrowia lipolytica TaxID=4952 RepID=Q6C4S8_YARLI|nr:YALI0E24035p [Yarrowia lipolytica CLIB122]KAB8285911.1 Brf1-like TBP-binding domain-containing protein [Yarrowia lipolytica]KAE8171798.1 Brf1-like TBP-binding domain-containing protein [Yarrowia lipolytica]KAJ8057312.1 Brf1-like TBP-binding domain-containing protein [Yarrowia lipolytica]QNP99166.1 Transcription factor IIIB 60 kDa subunit [Yarrowia lipolytica]RDW26117.1 Brf1-like TBP-binding domain-domain-containing protein [Yarrowia lipolytica]|eukprot:XP_504334.1 YALI0E24035p [Yarrowia lipolytica CLIB122]
MKCPRCGSTSIKRDGNDSSCANCGVVVDDAPIVSEVTFGESSSGAAVVHGSFVGADQSGIRNNNFHGESRELTLQKGKNRITALAHAMDIPQHIIEKAHRYFVLAVTKNFVKGRRSQYVVSACLYVACRRELRHEMLIDFADKLFCNVFAIGTTYLQLLKTLDIKNLPLIDPSIYIQRFASKLDFDNAKNVRNDAVRLVQRMGRDYLVEGRRPAGIAAAALLLAARMNNQRRSKTQIAFYAKVAEETLQRRLDEFRHTEAGRQTISVFRMTNIESQSDPPSYQKHRKREQEGIEEKVQDEIDAEMEEMMAQMVEKNENPEERAKEALFLEDTPQEKAERTVQNRAQYIIEYERERRRMLNEEANNAATEALLAMKTPHEQMMEDQQTAEKEGGDARPPVVESLSDLDDDPEIDSILLNDEERNIKEAVWTTVNMEYLQEQETKLLKIEADKAAGVYKEPKKRKRQKQKDGEKPAPPKDAAESTKQMVQQRAPSKKINYEKFSGLWSKRKKLT